MEDALKRIRRTGPDKETINVCYVIDDWRHLIGVLSIRTLLLAEEDDIIGDIMERNYICVQTLDDQEETARALGKYDFLALPVVDTENRLVGIVTVDDAIDVCRKRPRRIWKRWRLCCRRTSPTSAPVPLTPSNPVFRGCCY